MNCRDRISNHPQLLPTTHDKCKNKQARTGYPIGQYPLQDIHLLQNNTCQVKRTESLPYRLRFSRNTCLLHYTTSSKRILFLSTPLHSLDDLPLSIPIFPINNEYMATEKSYMIRELRPKKIYTSNYYIVILKRAIPKTHNRVSRNSIKQIQLLYQKQTNTPIRFTFISDPDIKKDLKNWFNYKKDYFSEETYAFFKEHRIAQNVIGYRGLFFKSQDILKIYGLDRIKIGDEIKIRSNNKPMSWTTDLCIATHFATSDAAKGKLYQGYGVIVKTILKPNEVLVDTSQSLRHSLYRRQQNEIISLPFNEQGDELLFKCQIHQLFFINSTYSISYIYSFAHFLHNK